MSTVGARRGATRSQHDRRRGEGGRQADSTNDRPAVRSLLQAAGMAPIADGDPVAAATVAGGSVRGLPLVELFDNHAKGTRYCSTTIVDGHGRLADRMPLRVLGWVAGTPVSFSTIPSAGIVVARRGGTRAVTGKGFLFVPATTRHGCRIRGGDRLLVVAHPTDDVLVVYAPFAVDAMTAAYHACVGTGENA